MYIHTYVQYFEKSHILLLNHILSPRDNCKFTQYIQCSKHYSRPKRREKISVEKLKKYFAFVDPTFNCVPLRGWENIK